MIQLRQTAILVLCALPVLSCSESLDENHANQSPVLDKDQTIHKPGEDTGNTPGEENPGEENPGEENPGEENPGEENPGEENPGEENPGEENPGEENPGEENPGEENPGEENPGEENPGEENPGEENPGEENPGEENPGNDTPSVNPTPNLPEKDPAHNDGDAVNEEVDGVPVLPLTYAPYTTLQRKYMPTIGSYLYDAEQVKSLIKDRVFKVYEKDKYERYGIGAKVVEGQPWLIRERLLKMSDPQISRKGKSLAYFWQVSDPQLIDIESPCRMEAVVVAPYVLASAYRPQGIYSKHMFDLHVQTARRLSDYSSRPFDFALVTGDIADNAQENEYNWFQTMMTGGVLNPDSGIDDDPIPGKGNDYTDPFYSHGIGNIPWYVAIGNHDMLYMGFSAVTQSIRDACTGDEVVDLFASMPVAGGAYRTDYNNGFIDASTPDAQYRGLGAKTIADPKRRLLSKNESLQNYFNAPGLPAGHGLDPNIMEKGWGYYAVNPIPGKPLKLITLDTNSGLFSEANMTSEQFAWLKNQLDIAQAKHELVILQSHHGTADLSGDVSESDFQKLLASYPNVILHITGHGHKNDSHVHVFNDNGYWEVMLASVVDFPSNSRIFEIVHEGQGLIDIYITNLEPNAPSGSFVDTAIHYAAARTFFGSDKDPIASNLSQSEHQNLILRTRVPKDIYDNLDRFDWSDTIESEVLLNKLEFNADQ